MAAEEQLQEVQQQEQEQEREQQMQDETLESADATDQVYSWPAIRFDVPPYRTYHFYRQFRSPSNPNNFLKCVKWYISLCLSHEIFYVGNFLFVGQF